MRVEVLIEILEEQNPDYDVILDGNADRQWIILKSPDIRVGDVKIDLVEEDRLAEQDIVNESDYHQRLNQPTTPGWGRPENQPPNGWGRNKPAQD
jgi:hypothetical protein